VADLTMHGHRPRATFPPQRPRARGSRYACVRSGSPSWATSSRLATDRRGIVGLSVRKTCRSWRTGRSPDLIINPHALPSRMTIAHLIEAIGAKAVLGRSVHGRDSRLARTPFRSSAAVWRSRSHRVGDEMMYDPASGRRYHVHQSSAPPTTCA
jgi:hypothetical protein